MRSVRSSRAAVRRSNAPNPRHKSLEPDQLESIRGLRRDLTKAIQSLQDTIQRTEGLLLHLSLRGASR